MMNSVLGKLIGSRRIVCVCAYWLSPECCERLVPSGATLVIFALIRSCKRIIPCMGFITYAIQVLLNLSKYDKTIKAVCDVENSVDMLLDLLQIYREKAGDKVPDKGSSIFTKACFLLVTLLQNQKRALVWHYYFNNNHNIMISIITLFWKSFSYN
nr:LOW QUALITY PROTEIN: abnormal spindle-like microcephaly-associated protein homolog [Oncorhynchus nerka]